jgi:hypothetical protein
MVMAEKERSEEINYNLTKEKILKRKRELPKIVPPQASVWLSFGVAPALGK